MLRIANTRTRWRERRDSGKTGERQRAANECNFDGIDVNWFDYWYEDRIEHATWKIHVLICAAFDTRIAHSASQHLISYHHDEGRLLLLLLLSFRVCDIFVFITFTNGIVKLFNINRSNWIKADPIHFDSMAIHIVTLLNLRFGRYVFGKTNLCDSASCLHSESMEEEKTTTTTHNVRTRKKSGSKRKTTHRMPNNLYYLLYWDVTVALSLAIYFHGNVRQNKLDAINENRNRTFPSYRKQIVFIRLSLSFVHFHSICYVFLSGFDFAIGLFLYFQFFVTLAAASDGISKSLMHN